MNKLLDLSKNQKKVKPIVAILIVALGSIIINIVFGLTAQKILYSTNLADNKDFFSQSLIRSIGLIFTFAPIALILFLFVKKFEKRKIITLGFIEYQPILKTLKGVFWGVFMCS